MDTVEVESIVRGLHECNRGKLIKVEHSTNKLEPMDKLVLCWRPFKVTIFYGEDVWTITSSLRNLYTKDCIFLTDEFIKLVKDKGGEICVDDTSIEDIYYEVHGHDNKIEVLF